MKRLAAGVTVAALLGASSVADAHHPDVTATPGCVLENRRASVFVTATAWDTGDPAHRINRNVAIEWWNGSAWEWQASGEFTSSSSSFTRALNLPANGVPTTARVRAVALSAWGPNGEYGSLGESREATVVIDRVCLTIATTTTVPNPPQSVPSTAPDPKLPPFVTTTTSAPAPLPEAPPATVVVSTPRFTG